MPGVTRATWIERKVSLEILEPGHERAIERRPQFVEPAEQALFGVAFGSFEPGNEITADLGGNLLAAAAAYARRAQPPGTVQLDTTLAQFGQQLVVHETVSHTEAMFGELIDQARRRDRSPVRFASARRPL
jgi:hypothetical protein